MNNKSPLIASRRKVRSANGHFAELVRASSASLLLRILAAGMGFGLYAYIGRVWGADGVGIFSQCLMVTTVSAMLARAGLDNVLIRFVAESRVAPHSTSATYVYSFATQFAFSIGLFFTAAVYLFAHRVAALVSTDQALVSALRISSVATIPLTFVYINGFSLQGAKQVSQSVFCIAVSVPLFTLVFCLLFKRFHIHDAPVISYVIGAVAAFAVSSYFWAVERPNGIGTKLVSRGSILNAAYPLLIMAVAQQSISWFGLIYLGHVSTTDQVGVFATATRVSAAIGFIVISINSIASPKFAELAAKEDRRQLQEVLTMSLRLATAIGLPVIAVAAAFSKHIMRLFGDEFLSGGFLLTVLAIGQIANIFFGQMGVLLIMTAHEKVYGLLILFTAAFNILVCLELIGRYGANGAAYAAALTMGFEACCTYVLVRKKLDLRLLPAGFSR